MGKPRRLRRLTALLTIIAMLVLALPGTALADTDDTVTITDTALLDALRTAAGVDSSHVLTEGDIEGLAGALDLSGKSISDITGLQFATGVTSIDLSDNTVRDISAIAALPLTTLDVRNNYLDISAGSGDMAVISALTGNGCAVEYDPQTAIPVSGVSLAESAVMCPGDTLSLTAAVLPEDAANQTVTWASGNEEIASVTAGGLVTAIEMGEVDITATTTDGGFEAVCAVTIKADKLGSTKYRIASGRISGVGKRTSVSAFITNLTNGADAKVYKADGKELRSGTVATGMSVALNIGGTERDRLTIVVNGDVNGDGLISISDYTLTRYDILSLKALNGAYKIAGDVNNDSKVSISDYTLMRYDILGLKSINPSAPTLPADLPEVSNPKIRAFLDMALAQLGDPYVWGAEGPDSFDCSGFVYYCLKQSGYTGSLWRTTANSYSKWSNWAKVDKNQLQPGDLMFYFSDNPSDGDHIGHIGIYLGNGYHVHASSDYGYIVICRVEGWYERMLSHGRRVNW